MDADSLPTPARAHTGARERILSAAEDLVRQQGPESLSIRRVSERSGYSAPTIYHHFGDKEGLTREVVEAGFARLLEQLRAVGPGPGPAGHLRALLRTFIAFGLRNSQYYWLFSTLHVKVAPPPPAVEGARALLQGALARFCRDGALGPVELEAIFQTLWALLHGLISLRLVRPDYPWSPLQIDLALEMVERGLLRGCKSDPGSLPGASA